MKTAAGITPKDKINYLRRQHYAANKDAINAQKREAYAKKNEKILNKQLEFAHNGYKEFIPFGTIITDVKTIAGKGSETELRVAGKLELQYGGNANDWEKKVGKIISEKYIFDIHWYEYNGKLYEAKMRFVKERKQ